MKKEIIKALHKKFFRYLSNLANAITLIVVATCLNLTFLQTMGAFVWVVVIAILNYVDGLESANN
jgi:phosphatidylglycerophosphate synthase